MQQPAVQEQQSSSVGACGAALVSEEDDLGLSAEDLEEVSECGLTPSEMAEACKQFRLAVAAKKVDSDEEALLLEDVDHLLRQLQLFMAVRFIWALIQEVDENCDGKVQITEFIWMVAKLRGRSSMSRQFYLQALPRSVKERFIKVFEILSDHGQMEKDDLISASRQLNPHVDTDSEDFKRALQDSITVEDAVEDEAEDAASAMPKKFNQSDFLVLQAKLRKTPPEIDVALLNFTDEEEERFAAVYQQWKQIGSPMSSPQELRQVLGSLGYPLPMDQVRRLMQNTELDGTRAIELREFFYILVQLGAGTSDKTRTILCPGASYEEAFNMGLSLEDLYELEYEDLVEIRKAGWSAHAVIKSGLAEAWQLRQVGYGADELRKIGWPAKQLKLAGFSLEELRNAGFSSESLRDCVSVLSKHRAQRSNEESALTLRPAAEAQLGMLQPTPAPYFEGGGPCGEKRWWSTPRIKAMYDGPPGCGGTPGASRSNVRARPCTS